MPDAPAPAVAHHNREQARDGIRSSLLFPAGTSTGKRDVITQFFGRCVLERCTTSPRIRWEGKPGPHTDNYSKSKNGKRKGRSMGAARQASRSGRRLACRFTTGVVRVEPDGRHVTLAVMADGAGQIGYEPEAEAPAVRTKALSRLGGKRAGGLLAGCPPVPHSGPDVPGARVAPWTSPRCPARISWPGYWVT